MNRIRKNIAVKSIAGIVLLLTLVFTVAGGIGYKWLTNVMLRDFESDAFRIADIAILGIDPDKIDEYYDSGGKSEDYMMTLTNFDLLCNASRSTFIYVILPDRTDYEHITFLFSTINHESEYTVFDFGYVRETTNDDYKHKYRLLCEGESNREVVLRNTGYVDTGAHITAMVPLKGSDGSTTAILCVQRQMDSFEISRRTYVRTVAAALVLLIIIIMAGQGLYLYRVVLEPVKKITDETLRFAEESSIKEKKLSDDIRNNDDIGLLAGAIDKMEEQITDFMEEQTRAAAEKERSRTELRMAQDIQKSQLPMKFPAFPDRKEFDIYASMDPAREVGGDFYDFFLIDDDHLALIIADVSGKGIPAALFMMVSKTLIQNKLIDGESLSEVLESVNNQLVMDNSTDMFVTLWGAVLEISTGTGIACNAGHEHPALRRRGGEYALQVYRHSPVVGAIEDIRYPGHSFRLEPGDCLFVYTDGVPEACNPQEQLFGTDRMIKVLNKDPEADPETVLHNVKDAIIGFADGAEQFDDITMLCLRYNGPEPGKGN
ncbi:MAG: SpoIIE family protein phosphatase [Blautia sp.]|nr:SpoIIE family protein phosphatase [Blautia sp.]